MFETAQVIDTNGLSVPYREIWQRGVISRDRNSIPLNRSGKTSLAMQSAPGADITLTQLTHFFPPFQHLLSERLRLSA